MKAIWPVAIITFKEGIRSRAIYGISIFALLMFAGIFLIAPMIMQEVGKVAVDMALSTLSFAGLLLVLFVGINLLAKDLDKRTIYMTLSRPISRSSYIIGKFAGMVLLIVSALSVLSILALGMIILIKTAYPAYFLRFSLPMLLTSILFIILSLILLSAMSFLFASITSTSFITLILTVITYVIGHSLSDIKALVEAPASAGIVVNTATVKLVQVAYYLLPNLSLLDIKTQAAHAIPVPFTYIASSIVYGIVYTVIAITAASVIFRRREFP